MIEKPEFRETLCPICSQPCVALLTEFIMLTWCEVGHVCLTDEMNRVETLYTFGESEDADEEIERLKNLIYERGDRK